MQNNIEGVSPKDIEAIEKVLDIIKSDLPFDFSDYKHLTIYKRIVRRATALNIHQLEDYIPVLKSNPDEVKALAKDFMISVTSFFRDQQVFNFIQENVIPQIISNATEDGIKVWVPGCATGEEAYTIAILFKEQLKDSQLQIKIFATDIDKTTLEVGSKGIYSSKITKYISRERLDAYFTFENSSYKVKPEIRKMMIFSQHDLGKNPPYCNVDFVSCRNVLIYLNGIAQKKVFSLLHFGLKRNGFLLLGMSESLPDNDSGFREINGKFRVFQKTDVKQNVAFDSFKTPKVDGKALAMDIKPPATANLYGDLTFDLLDLLATQTNRTGICIDLNYSVIHYFGNIAGYVKGKLFTIKILDLIPQGSRQIFQAAIHKAMSLNSTVVLEKFIFSELYTGEVQIIPHTAKSGKLLFMVLINPKSEVYANEGIVFDTTTGLNDYVVELEEEVKALKWQLSWSMEEINSSKENLQSFNEELLSANEELQSTNEEWQSVNEELQTINAQYQLRIKELIELNDDLNNYFRSNINAQLFVDNNMLIKKFSPAATKHINLRTVDIGRPLSELTTTFKLNTLIEDLKTVIDTGEVVTREVATDNRMWYQLQIIPYIRKSDNARDGAIVTFYDITTLKLIQKDLDDKNASLKRINAELDSFVYTASHDLTAPLSNLEALIDVMKVKLQSGGENPSHAIELVQSALARFKATIRDLADIGRIESEMLKEPDRISFETLVEDIQYSIHDLIQSSNARIVTSFNEPEMRFSKKNLRSILYNLISNAIKFSTPGIQPEVYVNTFRVPGFIVIMVKDNGIGIPEDQVASVFELYKRLDSRISGQGLGLYLVKKITESAKGKVEVESHPREGTVFRVYLPFDHHI